MPLRDPEELVVVAPLLAGVLDDEIDALDQVGLEQGNAPHVVVQAIFEGADPAREVPRGFGGQVRRLGAGLQARPRLYKVVQGHDPATGHGEDTWLEALDP